MINQYIFFLQENLLVISIFNIKNINVFKKKLYCLKKFYLDYKKFLYKILIFFSKKK